MEQNKRYIVNFVIFSLGYILLGLLLIFAPEYSRHLICYILGIGGILFGIFRIVWYFAKDDMSRTFHNDIPFGVVMLLGGVYLLVKPDAIWDWLPVLLGFAVVFDSIVKLQHAFDLRRTGFAPWWGVLAAALATGVLGTLLILGVFGKDVLLYYFGAVLIADGLVNLVTITLLAVYSKKSTNVQPQKNEEPPLPPEEDPQDVNKA